MKGLRLACICACYDSEQYMLVGSLNSINQVAFVMYMQCVLCVVGTCVYNVDEWWSTESLLCCRQAFFSLAAWRLIHTYHAVPLPCRSAKGLDCVFPIWFTQCCRVWFTHTLPFLCHAMNMLFWKRPLKATAGSQQGDSMGTVWEWHVGDLPAFSVFLLPPRVPGSLLSEACQSQMQVVSVKQSNVCHGWGEAYYFGARTWVLL
jgi:hypothetical protein